MFLYAIHLRLNNFKGNLGRIQIVCKRMILNARDNVEKTRHHVKNRKLVPRPRRIVTTNSCTNNCDIALISVSLFYNDL